MSGAALAGLGFLVMLGLIFARAPIGLAMLLCGGAGVWYVTGSWTPLLANLKSQTYDVFSSYSLSVVPLFLLMGQFATRGGVSRTLFKAAAAWLGHRRGGLAMAAIGACAGFGAICGSSLATAATMGSVALPEMRRYGYSGALSTGCLAAGGTLGILIPPSIVLVIYAILAEQNIIKMFVAAAAPGVLAAFGYVLAVAVYVRFRPDAAPAAARVPRAERWRALARVWPVLLIFLLVLGGIYAGWFTPTEGAAVGAAGTGLLAWSGGGLNLAGFRDCILATAVSTAMIFFIVLGAAVFNTFLALTQTPQALTALAAGSALSPWLILAAMLVFYLALGCVMDSLSMILLTVPIFFPMAMELDFGLEAEEAAIWFGVLILVVVEVGLVTPPVGMNLFVIGSLAPEVAAQETWRGVTPFLASDAIRIVLLTAFPVLSLGLVRLLY